MKCKASTVIATLCVTLMLTGCQHEQKVYPIKDECGPIYGSVYHSIKDEAVCRIKCRGTCESLDIEFVSSKFVDNGLRCHDCNCTCRLS